MANRIQILNWRQHGDDESYCYVGVFGADDPGDCQKAIEAEFEVHPSDETDSENAYYINDDILIEDGKIFISDGRDSTGNERRFRVTITEVK